MATENYSLLDAQVVISTREPSTTSNSIASLPLSESILPDQTPNDNSVGWFTDNNEISYESNTAPNDGSDSNQQNIDTLLCKATWCRTANGSVDQVKMESLSNEIEEITDTCEALIEFNKAVLGGLEIELKENTSGGARGRSGATIHFVYDTPGTMVAVCKKFPKQEELVRELSSVSRLREKEFTRFAVPAPLGVAKIKVNTQFIGVLISEVAKGQSIADLIEKNNTSDQLKRAVIEIAHAFGQLHTQPDGSGALASNSYLITSIERARHLITVLANEYTNHPDIGPLFIEEVRRQLNQLIQDCFNEHSRATIVHGDAHPGNLFWDPSTGVTFIDTASLHFSVDSFGNPIGTPEQDISSFIGRFISLCRKSSIYDNAIDSHCGTFFEVYKKHNTARLSENKLQFFELRLLLGELVQACNNGCSQDIRAVVLSLKQVPGWITNAVKQ